LTVICPSIVLGPWVNPIESLSSISSSLQVHKDMILGVASKAFGVTRPPLWVDVRDLALAHVEAAYIRPETSNKRFIASGPGRSTPQQQAEIIKEAFPEWAKKVTLPAIGSSLPHIGLDGSPLTKELGIKYRSLKECIVDMANQLYDQAIKEGLLTSQARL
jgi:nucleoside-diphosphate-sugar epimerase